MERDYEWETPTPRVHTYAGPRSGRSRRDPQLTADPSRLTFCDELDSVTVVRSPAAAAGYGAVNPNVGAGVGYAGAHPASDPVLRENYCVCAKTERERRLLLTVVVLSVLSLGLLATIFSLLPELLCNDACQLNKTGSNTGGIADVLPFMRSRLNSFVA